MTVYIVVIQHANDPGSEITAVYADRGAANARALELAGPYQVAYVEEREVIA
jgi:hypothetical protein